MGSTPLAGTCRDPTTSPGRTRHCWDTSGCPVEPATTARPSCTAMQLTGQSPRATGFPRVPPSRMGPPLRPTSAPGQEPCPAEDQDERRRGGRPPAAGAPGRRPTRTCRAGRRCRPCGRSWPRTTTGTPPAACGGAAMRTTAGCRRRPPVSCPLTTWPPATPAGARSPAGPGTSPT